MADISVPIAPGELIDKMTILEIKSERISDTEKLKNVAHELQLLEQTWASSSYVIHNISGHRQALKRINETLWEIEDDIRICEAQGDFSQKFVELARSVYITNDERARVKREINTMLGSPLFEEKSYADYQRKE